MKKIIKKKLYNTETAQEIGVYDNGSSRFERVTEILYKKKTGEYFLYGEGGPQTKYAVRVDYSTVTGGEDIFPLTYDEARSWAEEHMDADEYLSEFEIAEDDEGTERLNLTLPTVIKAKFDAERAKTGKSYAELIAQWLSK